MTDKEVESLCKVVWQPGGTILNPQAGDPGQPQVIPNLGLPVSPALLPRVNCQVNHKRQSQMGFQIGGHSSQALLALCSHLAPDPPFFNPCSFPSQSCPFLVIEPQVDERRQC